VTGQVFTAAGLYVGLWSRPGEELLAWRDHDGEWDLEELGRAVGSSLR